MIFTVRSDEHNYTFCENDTIRSILQNISLIIGTKKGTIPMYRDFGLPMAFVDRPSQVATTILAAEATEAIEKSMSRGQSLKTRDMSKMRKVCWWLFWRWKHEPEYGI